MFGSTLGGKKLCRKISDDVKSGNITYNINKPYNYIGYCLSTHLGDIILKFIVYFTFGMLTGFLFLKSFPTINIIGLIIVIITCILATIASTLLITAISLVSFFIEDASPLYWIYSKFILVLGTIFPIEYFPIFLQKILKYSPIYAVSYGPARLFVAFSYQSAIIIIAVQAIYILMAYLLCSILYKKGVKRINVNGG